MIACSLCGSRRLDRSRTPGAALRSTIAAKMPGRATLGSGKEHVGSLAWLCRVLQASGRFSALGRSLQVTYRKAYQSCAIKTNINAVSGLSEIRCVYEYPVLLESLASLATMPSPPNIVEALSLESIGLAVSFMDDHMFRQLPHPVHYIRTITA